MERNELNFIKFVIEQDLASIKGTIENIRYYNKYLTKDKEEFCKRGCDNIKELIDIIFKELPF